MRTLAKDQLPLVSICIAAYNAATFIADTLKSALAQDYPHLEIVVSDDGSTDRTREIVQTYEPNGIRFLRQEKTLGIHGNYNAAFRASTGKYVCNLDHDDLLEPDYVSTMVQAMESNSQISFAHSACRLIDAEGNFLGYERSIHGSFIRSGLDEWPRYVFGPRAVNRVMIRRSAFEAVGGYDERFAVSGDWKMHRDLLKLGYVFYCDKVLTSFRSHSVGKTGRRLLLAKDVLLHLQDMEQCWPLEVPGKAKLLLRARRRLAMGQVMAAADAGPQEAEELLRFLPLFGNFFRVRLLAQLIKLGGSGLIIIYCGYKSRLRQRIKNLLYKNPGCTLKGNFL